MKKDFHTYLHKAGSGVSLSHDERERMRRAVRSYMEFKPLRTAAPASARASFAWVFSYRPIAAALVLALFTSIAGVSYAAEGALPGEALYAIKTRINEPVAGALALTQSAKTEWAMGVAGARVEEAATLAAQGKLDATTQSLLQQSFNEHADIAERGIEREADVSPDVGTETATRFQARMSEYQRLLAQVGETTHAEVAPFADSLGSRSARVASIRTRAEENAALATSTDRAIAVARMQSAAQDALKASVKLARKASSSLAPSSVLGISSQLEDTGTSITEGEKLSSDDAPKAFFTFQKALAATEQISAYLRTSNAIHRRTGLVIAEPKDASAASFQARAESAGGGSADGASMKTLAAPAPTPVHAEFEIHAAAELEATTSSSTDSMQGGETQESGDKHGSEREYDRHHSEPTELPISIPTLLR